LSYSILAATHLIHWTGAANKQEIKNYHIFRF
jgi:hypothetical protein